MKTKEKVGAFVIRQLEGRSPELLLFTHIDHPEAPIQIPGGSIEPNESPEQALWRELNEEAGLNELPMIRKIGVSEVAWDDRLLRRHCYLLNGSGLPDTWEQIVEGGGEDKGLRFSYAWYSINASFKLSGDLGYFLNPKATPELYKFPKL